MAGPSFPSREWAEEFCKALDSSEKYRSAARGWKHPILFKISDMGPGFILDLKDGRCLGVEWFDDASRADAPVIISGKLSDWLDVINGKVNPLTALLSRRLRIEKGDLSLILRYSAAAIAMVSVAQSVGVASQ
ncbi:SCP2 sterol-binding domain-containing protein [Aeropyrum camini]|uniref:Putative sterol carrier protein n=1 Tax=Aeropyrum camini SY1 = JCM 12091 TaxID=1198449 RepID=U3TF93_9CREN|nr:SCP2 sterol-binding domain-containing protein [Aeropyrum camini]BAN90700.1 putative sterol carrier protein [Aeropyrum camini SY1 = JCM 12091]